MPAKNNPDPSDAVADKVADPALKKWFADTLKTISEGIYEKDNTLALALLAVLSGQSVFLYGPPGTAKSLMARRISCVFGNASYFEYLMQRFSTPDEVFGPIDITELKKSNYTRKTKNYLPSADIAFLDEIWKSSPAILNTLLTIINEREFRNGSVTEKVPLKAIISASNEFPQSDCGLDALYDRFIVRLAVSPISDRGNFEKVISDNEVKGIVKVPSPLTAKAWESHIKAINKVKMELPVLASIHRIRKGIEKANAYGDSVPIYISDRRWQKAVFFLKAAAHFSGKDRVGCMDVLLLKHCLWSDLEDKKILDGIIEDSIDVFGTGGANDIGEWKSRYDDINREITTIRSVKNRSPTVMFNDEESYVIDFDEHPVDNGWEIKSREFYIPCDELDEAIRQFTSDTDGYKYRMYQATKCRAYYTDDANYVSDVIYSIVSVNGPQITVTIGDMNEVIYTEENEKEIQPSLKNTYRRAFAVLREDLTSMTNDSRGKMDLIRKMGSTPFITAADIDSMTRKTRLELERMDEYSAELLKLERLVSQ